VETKEQEMIDSSKEGRDSPATLETRNERQQRQGGKRISYQEQGANKYIRGKHKQQTEATIL
jgi:hypothetical protein